jgi:PAS domain S-box-containing protein
MNKLQTLWNRLTIPPDSVQELDRRRQAQFISSVLVFIILLAVVSESILTIVYAPTGEYTGYWTTIAALFPMGCIYVLSRTKYHMQAGWLTVVALVIVIFAATFFNPTPDSAVNTYFLYFLILPILLSSILSLRSTVILASVCVAIIFLFPFFITDTNFLDATIGPFSFVMIVSSSIYAIARYRDALEQDRQRELTEKEERYRTLLETTYEGICIYAEGKILDANPGLARMFGYDPEEITGLPVLSLVPEEAHNLLARNVEIPFDRPLELMGIKKDDSTFHIELVPKTQIQRERTVGVLAVRDITERVLVEEALREERASLAQRVAERTAALSIANAELARAARLKDEFLANMSHELRTPLNAILGMSEVLRAELCGPLNAEQLKSVRTIEESGDHLLNLINDILDVSKIEAGKVELQIRSVAVEPVCRASLQLVKQQSYKKRLNVSSVFDSNVTYVQADERRLKQILVNLLSNAVKFTPDGGTIGLEVTGDTVEQTVHFTVWDTGIGITPEGMKRLFGGSEGPRPFVQLDSSLSRQYEGTGLGLSLVYRMTEMHGGSVSVESEVGKGSRFTVSLPWQPPDKKKKVDQEPRDVETPAPAPAQAPEPAPVSEVTVPTVLLAEDNPTNVEAISTYLSAMGYQVILAKDGIEAIQKTQEKRPSVILMDVQMPGMDGLEATRKIRADPDLSQVPIIAMTALAMPGDRERCLEAGADEYLPKPVSLKGLVKAIEIQIERVKEV